MYLWVRMMPDDFLEAWLRRLGMDRIPAPTVETLRSIVQSHQDSFPFENIDVYCGSVPSLEPPALAKKLIHHRRGGYCFELNGLLRTGLEALGFDVRPLMARVTWERDMPGPRTHAFLLVKTGDTSWLVDAGFGGPGPVEPIEMNVGGPPTAIGGTAYRLEETSEIQLARRSYSGAWAPLYLFNLGHIGFDDLAAGNELAATAPGSIFRQGLKVARQSPQTRISLNGRELKRFAGAELVEARTLQQSAEVLESLTTDFGIELGPEAKQALLDRLESSGLD